MSSCSVQLALRPKRSSMQVVLHEPSTREDECPILQDRIASAQFEQFPCPFMSAHPTFTAMTLQCGHTFHAMALVYHWARNRNVLCPVCRSGPKNGQCLAISRLPREWKYSMASRTRRERKQDMIEEEVHNRQLVEQTAFFVPALKLEIQIQAEVGASPSTWTLQTHLIELQNSICFVVPTDELRRIPYPCGTYMRLIPYTNVHILQPSRWFKAGMDPGSNFSAGTNGQGEFTHLHLNLTTDHFTSLMTDMIVRQIFNVDSGGQFQLTMLADEHH